MNQQEIVTKSLCPQCLAAIEAKIIERDGKIYIHKYCPVHGESEHPHKWHNSKYYNLLYNLGRETKRLYPVGLLIDLNYECNQNCSFCFAQANERKEAVLTIPEIIAQVRKFKGVYVYLCGGEPTLREDIFTIIREIKKLGFRVVLMTNGKKLVDLEYVSALARTGLDIIQLQFDSFEDAHYEFMRNEKLVDVKLKAIENLKTTKISIYLYAAVIKGLNDSQVPRIIDFAAKNSHIIRVVYFSPVWREGRTKEHDSINLGEVVNLIGEEYGISEEEFLEYITFDYYSSAIWQMLTKSPFFKFVPCTLNCYFFNQNGAIYPLSKLLNLKTINQALLQFYGILSGREGVRKKDIFVNLKICVKEFLINKKMRMITFDFLRHLILFYVFKTLPAIKNNHTIQIRLESFFDRLNSDFNMMEQCNLYSYFNNELMPFCRQEIIKLGGR